MKNMSKYSSIGVYEADLVRFNTLAFTTRKSNIQLFHEVVTLLENALKSSITYQAKYQELTVFFDLEVLASGKTVTLAFVPRMNVYQKKSKPIKARFSKEGKFKGIVTNG